MNLKWFDVKAKASLGEIFIYGVIDDMEWWGDEITPKTIQEELAKLKDVDTVNLYVNSPGGSVFAGAAIFNELRRFDKPITAYVDGLAASIASLVVLAADKVVMPANALMMIHRAYMCTCGNAPELRDSADKLEKIEDTVIITEYIAKTGLEKEKLIDMMNVETWMSGSEAVELGFADEMIEDQKIAACITGNKVIFNNVEVQLNKFKAFPKSKFTEHTPTKETTTLKQRHRHKINMLSA